MFDKYIVRAIAYEMDQAGPIKFERTLNLLGGWAWWGVWVIIYQ